MNALPILRIALMAVMLILSLQVGPAQADDAATMDQFFYVNPADKSAALMSEVFGPEAWQKATSFASADDIPGKNDATPGGMLGLLSSVLNLACMLLTVIIIVWGAVSANLSATIDGSAAARHYNVVWVPIRSVASFMMLLPVVGGYSLIQVIGMKAIFLSIGIANAGYTLVLKDFYAGAPTVPIQVNGVAQVARNVFASEVCRLSIVDANGASMIEIKGSSSTEIRMQGLLAGPAAALVTGSPDLKSNARKISYDGIPGSGLSAGVCGTSTVKQTENPMFASTRAAASTVYTAKVKALDQLIVDMRPIAADFVRLSTQTDNSQLPSETSGKKGLDPAVLDPLIQRYLAAQQKYRVTLVQAASNAVKSLTDKETMQVMSATEEAAAQERFKEWGWMMAGGLYWNMQAFNRSVAELVSRGTAETAPPAFDDLASGKISLVNRQFYDATTAALRPALDRIQNTDGFDTSSTGYKQAVKLANNYGSVDLNPSVLGEVMGPLRDLIGINWVTSSVVSSMTENGDFVWGLTQIGHWCWNAGSISLMVSGISAFADGATGGEGKGASIPIPNALVALTKGAATILGALAIPLLLTGFFLAFYLPFTPLILWLINIVGWMIQSIKAVMAMPVWAAAHSIPEGEGIAGQHARMGYMLMIGIILRPLLLFSGLMMGALVLQMAGYILRFMMPIMFASFDITDPPSLFGFLAMLMIFAGLCVSLALKSFSLSHELADEILTWIGGTASQLGDAHEATKTQQLITGAIAGGGSSMIGNVIKAASVARDSRRSGAVRDTKDRQRGQHGPE